MTTVTGKLLMPPILAMNYQIDAPVIIELGYPSLVFFDWKSDESLKDLLATFARYFKAEMGFDSLQFDETMYDDKDFNGFLFLQRAMDLVESEDHYPSRVVGGGVFVQHRDSYELDWVWHHPFSRNRRVLKDNWKVFKKRFGLFSVGPPLSVHMAAFVRAHHAPPPLIRDAEDPRSIDKNPG